MTEQPTTAAGRALQLANGGGHLEVLLADGLYDEAASDLGIAIEAEARQQDATLDVERISWDVWEYVIDSLQPQWKRGGESEKWGKALRDYIIARLEQDPVNPIPKPQPRVKLRRPLRSTPRPVDARAKEQTFARDDYLCQWCRVAGGHLDAHHRLRRSQGGQDRPEHMVSVHRLCHLYIHDNPAEAKRRGFLVTSADGLGYGWE